MSATVPSATSGTPATLTEPASASSGPAGLNVVILAAGQGKRMASDLPKVLHPIAGRPMLGHVLDAARALDPSTLVVVVGHGADEVRRWLERDAGGEVETVLQSPQLGTGHAVRQAAAWLDPTSHTLVLYGDVPLVLPHTLEALVEAGCARRLALLTARLSDPTGYGRIVRNADGAVTAIVEHKDATPEQRRIHEVNSGILCVETAFLLGALDRLGADNAQAEYYLTDIVADAVANGITVGAHLVSDPGETAGVNSKRELASAERVVQQRRANALLDAGVTLLDPARLDVRGTLDCGRDVTIDVGCVFEGLVSLGDGVTIGPYCVIRNATFADGSSAAAFSHIDGGTDLTKPVTIGRDADVGPFVRIRPGTTLADHVHIGNFVEVKNAQIGAGSKAGHLSYLGDATIGERVNIGAGTITCNYDGAGKHRTVIEDDVFVGSDTQLVAPVTVQRGATLGAGTTLTRTAPAGALTVSRVRQTTIPGWQRPVRKPGT